MRFLSCKIRCPFICICKPSAPHIYTATGSSLTLQNGCSHSYPNGVSTANASDHPAAETTVVKDERLAIAKENGNCSKSSLRKVVSLRLEGQQKKKVQWVDSLGKELVEIREYESSDVDDSDREVLDGTRGCVCIIL